MATRACLGHNSMTPLNCPHSKTHCLVPHPVFVFQKSYENRLGVDNVYAIIKGCSFFLAHPVLAIYEQFSSCNGTAVGLFLWVNVRQYFTSLGPVVCNIGYFFCLLPISSPSVTARSMWSDDMPALPDICLGGPPNVFIEFVGRNSWPLAATAATTFFLPLATSARKAFWMVCSLSWHKSRAY